MVRLCRVTYPVALMFKQKHWLSDSIIALICVVFNTESSYYGCGSLAYLQRCTSGMTPCRSVSAADYAVLNPLRH
jgi:hypothetical protein